MARAVGRVVIDEVRPVVDCGARAAKAAAGLPLLVSATVIVDGPDRLLAWVRHGPPRPAATAATAARLPGGWRELAMAEAGNDRFTARLVPARVGPWSFEVLAVPDDYGSWLRDLRLRVEAGQDVALELALGAQLAERRAARAGVGAADR
ncbi:MAG: maltotransferase domain-containing protein, partial [Candidatus Dormibacteria bacterium]